MTCALRSRRCDPLDSAHQPCHCTQTKFAHLLKLCLPLSVIHTRKSDQRVFDLHSTFWTQTLGSLLHLLRWTWRAEIGAILLVDHVLLQLVLLRHMTHLLCRLHDLVLRLLSLDPRHHLRLRRSGWSDPLLLLLLLLLKLAYLHLLQLLLGELLLLRLWLVLLIMHHRLRKALQTHLLMLLLSHLRRELLLLLVSELLL